MEETDVFPATSFLKRNKHLIQAAATIFGDPLNRVNAAQRLWAILPEKVQRSYLFLDEERASAILELSRTPKKRKVINEQQQDLAHQALQQQLAQQVHQQQSAQQTKTTQQAQEAPIDSIQKVNDEPVENNDGKEPPKKRSTRNNGK
jgi:hypothetical protein